jgi:hypothetical protein
MNPLMSMPVDFLVPIPLHLFLGLCNDRVREIIDIAKQLDKNIVASIESILKENGIDNRAWYGDLVGMGLFLIASIFFTNVGNQVNRLITSCEILRSIRALFPQDVSFPKVDNCIAFLCILGKIQAFAKARWLDVEQIRNLAHEINNLRNLFLRVG